MSETMRPIYLDYNSTTPVDPQVFQAMEPYFKLHFGNAASFSHQWGWAAQKAVEQARGQVASLINAKPLEITFTSGATEANNWVLFGMIEQLRAENRDTKIHIIASHLEHSSVTNALKEAQRRGVEVDFVKTNAYGQVEVAEVEKLIKPHTKLLSFIWVQNEIGSINPMQDLATLARDKKIYLHTDATQAVGKIDVDVQNTPVDFLSCSAHKFYGPKGVGALYIRGSKPKVTLPPFIFGGGQEHGRRSGTANVPAIVGMGAAAELCQKLRPKEQARTTELRQHLWEKIQAALPGTRLNGHPTQRSPVNLNITVPGKNIEALLPRLGRIAFSQGSACHTGTLEISPILNQLGLNADQAQGTLRLSLGRWTTREELDIAVEILAKGLS